MMDLHCFLLDVIVYIQLGKQKNIRLFVFCVKITKNPFNGVVSLGWEVTMGKGKFWVCLFLFPTSLWFWRVFWDVLPFFVLVCAK